MKIVSKISSALIIFFQKERDLELVARLGQQLLKDKCSLQKKNENLEEQLLQANEKVRCDLPLFRLSDLGITQTSACFEKRLLPVYIKIFAMTAVVLVGHCQ